MNIIHIPVMREEVLAALNIKDSGIYVDATVGLGGHAEAILQLAAQCTVIGIDRDEQAIEISRERLDPFKNVYLVRESFSNMKNVVHDLGFKKVNGILLDLGVSTLHLRSEGRGFSFLRDEPLDMRMDRRQGLTAEDIINKYSERDLADLIWRLGDERYSRKIARAIVNRRRRQWISSCRELAEIIEKTLGRHGRIHPATRTFQALRIEVNKELDELPAALESGLDLLDTGARFCVLSYHSLEDRIVKNAFRKLAKEGLFTIITRKPLVPTREEQRENPSSRSAKLRIGEKI